MSAATCPHLQQGGYRSPVLGTPVFKEECTQCFDSWDGPHGIDVCLTCYNGGCRGSLAHSTTHAALSGHPLVVNIKRHAISPPPQAEPPPKLSKVAIGVEGGMQLQVDEYDFETCVRCTVCGIDVHPSHPEAAAVRDVVDAILAAPTQSKQEQLKAWELEPKPCPHVNGLVQLSDAPKLAAKELAHCALCDINNNLWICLTCGHLGCGRRQYDLTGQMSGNGHALNHANLTGHPCACKLGTITPEGTGDAYCYTCDETVIDTKLPQHLATFGIAVAGLQKTEKTMAEMELDQNLNLTFNPASEEGRQLIPAFGPGYTGLRNLGNTCYVAAVLQVVFSIPLFQETYFQNAFTHTMTCTDKHANCFCCQMNKIADGLLSGRYSVKPTESIEATTGETPKREAEFESQKGIPPLMFKSLVGKDHPDFGTMRQQDAMEFWHFLMSQIQQKERIRGLDPTSIFSFTMQQRIQCLQCRRVRYSTARHQDITVPIPMEGKVATEDGNVHVSFHECLRGFVGEDVVEFNCPNCHTKTQALKSCAFETFPDTLVVNVRRFVFENWVPQKLGNALLEFPDVVDLHSMTTKGQQAGEELLPEDVSPAPPMDPITIEQLIAMGFPRVRCEKAVMRTGNAGTEVAMNWLIEHMDDPDIDVPSQPSTVGPISDAAIQQLTEMGFTPAQARKALLETDGDTVRAVDWLFSHPEDPGTVEGTGQVHPVEAGVSVDSRPPVYNLHAFITHKGSSIHCGHYVAHIKKEGQWVMYDDIHVALSPSPPVGKSYIYVFRKRD